MRFLTALLACVIAGVPPPQELPAARIADEIARARAALEASASESDRAAAVARLDRARSALDAGRVYLAAYLLESGWEGAKNFAFVKASSGITTEGAFLKKWTSMGEPHLARTRPDRVPAVVEAIASGSEARAVTTYHASRMYGQDSGLFGGLYYLADSHSVVEFARLLRELRWPVLAARPSLRSLSTELAALDTEMTTAYEKMERANHPTYISASAALKQARTLNDRGEYAGALFQYLLSRYVFAPLRGPAAAQATSARVTEARAGLPAGGDHTIAELFLQLADESLAGGSEIQRRNAATVLEDILPAYRSAIAAPASTTTDAANAQVTITLVRWPFT